MNNQTGVDKVNGVDIAYTRAKNSSRIYKIWYEYSENLYLFDCASFLKITNAVLKLSMSDR